MHAPSSEDDVKRKIKPLVVALAHGSAAEGREQANACEAHRSTVPLRLRPVTSATATKQRDPGGKSS